MQKERAEANPVPAVVNHVPWACGLRKLLLKRLHAAAPSSMPVTIVYLRVAAADACH